MWLKEQLNGRKKVKIRMYDLIVWYESLELRKRYVRKDCAWLYWLYAKGNERLCG